MMKWWIAGLALSAVLSLGVAIALTSPPKLLSIIDRISGGGTGTHRAGTAIPFPYGDLDALADAVVAAIEADAGARPIVVSSFELGVLQRIRATAPTVRIALLSTTPDAIDVAASEGFEQVNLLAAVVSARTMRQVRAAELDVHVWTIDGEDTVRDFLGRGVDGVITDTVPAAVAARAAFCEAYVCPVADAGTPSPDDAGVSPDASIGQWTLLTLAVMVSVSLLLQFDATE